MNEEKLNFEDVYNIKDIYPTQGEKYQIMTTLDSVNIVSLQLDQYLKEHKEIEKHIHSLSIISKIIAFIFCFGFIFSSFALLFQKISVIQYFINILFLFIVELMRKNIISKQMKEIYEQIKNGLKQQIKNEEKFVIYKIHIPLYQANFTSYQSMVDALEKHGISFPVIGIAISEDENTISIKKYVPDLRDKIELLKTMIKINSLKYEDDNNGFSLICTKLETEKQPIVSEG